MKTTKQVILLALIQDNMTNGTAREMALALLDDLREPVGPEFYMLYNTETGEWGRGGVGKEISPGKHYPTSTGEPSWGKTGKVWAKLGELVRHLTMMKELQPTWLALHCRVVVLDSQPATALLTETATQCAQACGVAC